MEKLKHLLKTHFGFILKDTRQEPGLPISEVAKVITETWDITEVKSLIKELEKRC